MTAIWVAVLAVLTETLVLVVLFLLRADFGKYAERVATSQEQLSADLRAFTEALLEAQRSNQEIRAGLQRGLENRQGAA